MVNNLSVATNKIARTS